MVYSKKGMNEYRKEISRRRRIQKKSYSISKSFLSKKERIILKRVQNNRTAPTKGGRGLFIEHPHSRRKLTMLGDCAGCSLQTIMTVLGVFFHPSPSLEHCEEDSTICWIQRHYPQRNNFKWLMVKMIRIFSFHCWFFWMYPFCVIDCVFNYNVLLVFVWCSFF